MSTENSSQPEHLSIISEVTSLFQAIQARTRSYLLGEVAPKPTTLVAATLSATLEEVRFRAHVRDKSELSAPKMSYSEIARLKELFGNYQQELADYQSDSPSNRDPNNPLRVGTARARSALSTFNSYPRISHFEKSTKFLLKIIEVSGCSVEVVFPESLIKSAHIDLAFTQSLLERKLRRFDERNIVHPADIQQRKLITILLVPRDNVANREIDAQLLDHRNEADDQVILELPVDNRAVYSHEMEHVIQVLIGGQTCYSPTLNEGTATYYGDCDELSFNQIEHNFRTQLVRSGAEKLRRILKVAENGDIGLTASSLPHSTEKSLNNIRYLYGHLFVDFYIQHFGEEKLWQLYTLSTANPSGLNEEELLAEIFSNNPNLLRNQSKQYTLNELKIMFEQFMRLQFDNSWKRRATLLAKRITRRYKSMRQIQESSRLK